MMFISAACRTHELLSLIPLDLLREVRSLYGLVSQSNGVLDRQACCSGLPRTPAVLGLTRSRSPQLLQELETLVAYLGLDWSLEELDGFLQSRGAHGLLQFMSTFVRIIEQVRAARCAAAAAPALTRVVNGVAQGAVTGTKTLTVRNWFPGMWYVRERKRGSDQSGLYLLCQTASGGWTDAGKVRACWRSAALEQWTESRGWRARSFRRQHAPSSRS
jgi:hypothetical protein